MKETRKAEIAGMSMASYSLLTSGRRAFSIRDIKGITTLASVILSCQHNGAFITGVESALLKNTLPEHLKPYISDPTTVRRKARIHHISSSPKKNKDECTKSTIATATEETVIADAPSPAKLPVKYAFLTEGGDLIPIITEFTPKGITMFKSWTKTDEGWKTQFIEGENRTIELVSQGTKLRAKSKTLEIKESAYKIGSKITKLDTRIKSLVSIDIKDDYKVIV